MKKFFARFFVEHPIVAIITSAIIISILLIAGFVGMVFGFIYNPILTFCIMGGIVVFCFSIIIVCSIIESYLHRKKREKRFYN